VRTKVKPEQLDPQHREVGEAVGVDRELTDVFDGFLTHHALDRGARLAPVQHDGLVVEEAPSVVHMGVDPDRGGTPTRVDPGLPDRTRCLQAHHV